VRAIVRGQCPNCGGPISDDRLEKGLPCADCLPKPSPELLELADRGDRLRFLEELCNELSKAGRLKGYRRILEEEEALREFEQFFERALGNRPWSAQRTWARRVLGGKSFTILAPTGVGKSVFGIIMALYLASRGAKCYLVLPTSVLVKQASERAEAYAEKLGAEVRILAYLAKSGKAREELLERIKSGDYDVLITTSQFLARHFELLEGSHFDFIFVDDVDAVMKSSRNIDKILVLLGLPSEAVEEAYELVKLKLKVAAALSSRRGVPPEMREELERSRERLRKRLEGLRIGTLVISTATGRPRGLRVRLFRELLGFEIGSRAELLRNVVDAYSLVEEGSVEERVAEIVKALGRGGLIFLQPGVGEDYVKRLLALLEEKGIKAALVTSRSKEALEAFERGELDVLVGYAIYYGLLVRGVDLPHVIRYAVFAGVPHFRFTAEVSEAGPLRLLQLAQVLRSVVTGDEGSALDRLTAKLRRQLANLEAAAFQRLSEALVEGVKPEGYLGYLYELFEELRERLKDLLSRREVLEALEARTLASIRFVDGKPYLLLPDAPTYLQASGRTSRMYAGGISRGLAVVVTDDEKLLSALMKQVSWYVDEVSWTKYEELDLGEILKEIDEDRRKIRDLWEGRVKTGVRDLVKTALVVVESPTKARTIASFFGRPSRRRMGNINVYEVSVGDYILLIAASKGHLLDLVTDEGFYGVVTQDGRFIPVYSTIKRCRKCGEQFTELGEGGVCPYCGSENIVDQLDTINALREAAREVDLVLLATDPDTEGEKIAWDLYLLLSPYTGEIRRIEFHEITRRAFEEALRNPRAIDMRRVEAQLVRRIEDRWIGFSLSQKLWTEFGRRWLSAGRVQTPVLGWVIERFRKAKDSIKPVFRLRLENGLTLSFECEELEKPAREIAKELRDGVVVIEQLGVELSKIPPPPPFTTDAMLREAAASLRVGVDDVMRIAQELFEMGLITYHRTDSAHVSGAGIAVAKSYIAEKLGAELFVGRSWAPPGAHECIRPTRPYDAETLRALVNQGIIQLVRPLTQLHYRLYDLIFRRFIASQMREAVVRVAKYRASTPYFSKEFTTYVEVVEPGFTRVYRPFTLATIEPGSYRIVEVRHRKVPTIRLYTQADLVARMREERIGRPSTYAKIISTLLARRYVVETKRRRLLPTKLGMKVYEYLERNYENLISVQRTRKVEEMMDKVERGELNYLEVLREFYEEVRTIASVQ